jgi:serine protease Do
MSTRKSSIFYGVLIAFSSLVVGMVIASRLDLTPGSLAGTLTVPATNSAPLTGPIDSTTFRTIAHDAAPSVVSIITTVMRTVSDGEGLGDLFGLMPQAPGRRGQAPQKEPARGAGSGFIIDKNGYILTNNHVVEDATSIEVKLSTMRDEDPYGLSAKVIGRDELSDTALLQLTDMPKTELVPAKFGDSSQMAPGDWVMAIGNPFGLSNTVTVGVVSAVGRQTPVSSGRYEDFIQTDAAINRGNSGGPLLNVRGEVIGINTMIVTDSPIQGMGGGNVGIGFAVPINTVRDLLPQLRTGKVVRGRIGVSVGREPITEDYAKDLGLPSVGGAEIRSVEADSPAAKAGMRRGDVVIDVNGKTVRDNNDLVSLIAGTKPGTTIPVKVVRQRKVVTLNVTVGELNLAQEQQQALSDTEDRTRPEEPQDTALGMKIRPLTSADRRQLQVPAGQGAAIISDVTPFGPAANSAILPNDVILEVQGTPVKSVDEVNALIDKVPSGGTARVVVWRFSRGTGQEVFVPIRRR